MEANFDKIMEFIFKWEGWHSDIPGDAGGKTVWGITERVYPEEFPALWDMSKEDSKVRAKFLFRRDYWDKINGDDLPNGVDALVMDTCVNMGKFFALQLKPLSLSDGIMERLNRYTNIAAQGNNIKFLRGWFRRVYDLYQFIKLNI